MKALLLPILLSLLLLGCPLPAWALQTHGGHEGLYAHQGAHLLFLASMISFALRLRISRLTDQPAWRWMARGAWLFAAWNIWAFTGHFIALAIPDSYIVALEDARVPSLYMDSWQEIAYYFLKMDHLLSLPALLLFYLGLRTMHRTFPQRVPVRERRKRRERRKLDRRLL